MKWLKKQLPCILLKKDCTKKTSMRLKIFLVNGVPDIGWLVKKLQVNLLDAKYIYTKGRNLIPTWAGRLFHGAQHQGRTQSGKFSAFEY